MQFVLKLNNVAGIRGPRSLCPQSGYDLTVICFDTSALFEDKEKLIQGVLDSVCTIYVILSKLNDVAGIRNPRLLCPESGYDLTVIGFCHLDLFEDKEKLI